MRKLVVATLLLVGVLVIPSSPNLTAVGEPLSGTVTSGGAPLGGARIDVTQQSPTPASAQTTSDTTTGAYAVTVPDGDYFIQVSKPGYQTFQTTRTLSAASPTIVDVDLVALPPIAVSGRIVAGDTSTGVAGTVRAVEATPLADKQILEFPTAIDGTFSVSLPAIGSWQVSVRAPGYSPSAPTFVSASTALGDIVVQPGAFVTGVVRTTGGAPIVGAQVSAFGATLPLPVTTGADGRYLIDLGSGGNFTLSVSASGFLSTTVPTATYAIGTATRDVTLARPGSVTGVLTGPAGQPLAGVFVSFSRTGAPSVSAATGTDGRFTLIGLQPGTGTLSSGSPNPAWVSPRLAVTVLEGLTVTQSIRLGLASTGTIELRTSTGLVNGSLPQTGVAVCAQPGVVSGIFQCSDGRGWAGFTTSAPGGVSQLPAQLPPGQYNVTAFVGGVPQPGLLRLDLVGADTVACTLFVDNSSPSGCGSVVVPDPTGSGNVSVQSLTPLQGVTAVAPLTLGTPGAGTFGPVGPAIGFSAAVTPGASVTVTVVVDDPAQEIDSFWKWNGAAWYDATALATITKLGSTTQAVITITDNGTGDADPAPGVIRDPGVLGVRARISYTFAGFRAPVDAAPVVNAVKAGSTVPLKWRLTTATGEPVADRDSFTGFTLSPGGCAANAVVDTIEVTSTSTGLVYLGDGNWQYNWKTPRTLHGCVTLELHLADGSTHTALFTLR